MASSQINRTNVVKIKIVARGPRGAQGVQGPKGDTTVVMGDETSLITQEEAVALAVAL